MSTEKKEMPPKQVKIEYMRGCEGNSLYINDHRVAGPKPWGGGDVIEKWLVDEEEINIAIGRG